MSRTHPGRHRERALDEQVRLWEELARADFNGSAQGVLPIAGCPTEHVGDAAEGEVVRFGATNGRNSPGKKTKPRPIWIRELPIRNRAATVGDHTGAADVNCVLAEVGALGPPRCRHNLESGAIIESAGSVPFAANWRQGEIFAAIHGPRLPCTLPFRRQPKSARGLRHWSVEDRGSMKLNQLDAARFARSSPVSPLKSRGSRPRMGEGSSGDGTFR